MKTVKLLAALLASAALLAACKDDNPSEKEVVSFSSFGFTAEANPDFLVNDFVVEDITTQYIDVTLPFGTAPEAVVSLAPTFTVTEGATVYTVDETGAPTEKEVVSGETYLDFSEEVSLVVAKNKKYSLYTVKVTVEEASQWAKVAETPGKMWSDPVLSINRHEDKPYIVGTDSLNRYPYIFKYDGSAELQDIAGPLAEETTTYLSFEFDPDNNPYVTYYGGTQKTQAVVAVKDGAVTSVGDAGSLLATTGSSSSGSAVFPISANEVWAAHQNNTRNHATVARRALNLALYDGATWTNGNTITGRIASDYAFCVIGRYYKGVPYLFIYNQNTQTVSLYHYADGSWATDYESLAIYQADGQTKATLDLYALQFDFDSKGNFYLMTGADYSVTNLYNIGVVKVSKEDGKQTIIGGETDININTYRSCDFALDANDVPYLVYTKPEGDKKYATIRYIDPKTKTWSEEVKLSDANADWVQLRFAEDGTGYIAVSNEDTDKYDLYATAE